MLQVYFLYPLFMKKNPITNPSKKRTVTLKEVLKIRNIKRALRESGEDQIALLRKHGMVN